MYRLMFEPYFGMPLAMMDRGHHAKARQRMYETTLNAADSVITRGEVFGDSLYRRLRYALHYHDAPRRISCNGDRTPAREVLATRNL